MVSLGDGWCGEIAACCESDLEPGDIPSSQVELRLNFDKICGTLKLTKRFWNKNYFT